MRKIAYFMVRTTFGLTLKKECSTYSMIFFLYNSDVLHPSQHLYMGMNCPRVP